MQQRFLALIPLVALTSTLTRPALARGDEDWAKLDREIEALASNAAQANPDGPSIGGLLRTAFVYLPNQPPPTSQDLTGVTQLYTQLWMEGQVGEDYGYKLQLEAKGGTAQVLDAYGTWQTNEHLRITMGRFRSPLSWESQLGDSDTLFLVRTDMGQLFYQRDDGAMASGALEMFRWNVSTQNGQDNLGESQAFTLRAALDLLGGGVGLHQGAYGAGEETRLSVGAGYYDDQSVASGSDGTIFTGDAQFQLGRLYADAMVSDFGDATTGVFANRSDSTPWSLAASWMIVENQWEVALRYQDTDNILNETDATAGVNYYVSGHDVKWQVNLDRIQSDDPKVDDTWRFGLGLNIQV